MYGKICEYKHMSFLYVRNACAYKPAYAYLCLYPCVVVPQCHSARQPGCVARWLRSVCVFVCMEQVCRAALRSLLPICAPVCVPPAPTLCQQHRTTARRPRREGCGETERIRSKRREQREGYRREEVWKVCLLL